MATQGPNNPSNGITFYDASYEWTTPENIYSSDANYATATNFNHTLPRLFDHLVGNTFGFSVPTGSTINGIVAEVSTKASHDVGYDYAIDISVHLVKSDGATLSAEDKGNNAHISTTEAYITYGDSTSLWGETWSPEDINSNNFGLGFQVSIRAGGGTNHTTAYVNHIRITVYYTEGGAPATNIKSVTGVLKANVKSFNGVLAANIKNIDGLA
jgi:hypothetical protein